MPNSYPILLISKTQFCVVRYFMDDKSFDNQISALDWIQSIENEGAQIRETDIYPRLKEWAHTAHPLEILDMGCGQGVCSEKVLSDGRHYTGLEPSPHLLERAKLLYANERCRFVQGDIYEMPFDEDSFDAAFSVAVWHLLSDLKKASAELSRVLKTNGHFLLITANPDAYSLWTHRYQNSQQEGRRFVGKLLRADRTIEEDVLYLHSLKEILDSLHSAGLTVQNTETFRESDGGMKQYLSIQGRK